MDSVLLPVDRLLLTTKPENNTVLSMEKTTAVPGLASTTGTVSSYGVAAIVTFKVRAH